MLEIAFQWGYQFQYKRIFSHNNHYLCPHLGDRSETDAITAACSFDGYVDWIPVLFRQRTYLTDGSRQVTELSFRVAVRLYKHLLSVFYFAKAFSR